MSKQKSIILDPKKLLGYNQSEVIETKGKKARLKNSLQSMAGGKGGAIG